MKGKKLFKLIFVFLFFLSWFIPLNFIDASLDVPTIVYPKSSDSPVLAGKIEFRWIHTGANYYKYHINLLTIGESREGMSDAAFQEIYNLDLGDYSWAVSSCSNSIGTDCGNWSGNESFTIESAPDEMLKGLVPCGRKYDNPQTDIIESKPCQMTDIFVLIKYILDFVLWRVGPIILVLLVLITGLVSYFNVGSPDINVRIKSILKSSISGYIVIFLAWLIVNTFLAIIGYRIGIFGRWWEIRF